jgi:hypothetical protein
MSNTTISPNMSLILPTPGQEPGPQYAADQNQDLLILDGHNHSPGSGVQITPAGLDISTNLNFQNNSTYNVYSVVFSMPAPTSNLTTLYTNTQSGGGLVDLFFNDGAGNIIALTKAGEVNATIASLPGESYAGGTFTWKQGAGSTTPANFDIGSITIRPNAPATTNGVVLGPPSSISSQYNVQLPIVPVATSIMQLDPSGNMLATLTPDNSTIVISSNQLVVPAVLPNSGAITEDMLAPRSTGQTVGIGGVAVSPNVASFSVNVTAYTTVTGMNCTLTTTGRPVMVALQSPNGNDQSSVSMNNNFGFLVFEIFDGVSTAPINSVEFGIASGQSIYPPSFFWLLDNPRTAGTYTYSVQISVQTPTSTTALITNCQLIAYEI